MGKYIVKRVALGILSIFIVATLTFFLMNMVPGGPFVAEKSISAEAQAALAAKYGLKVNVEFLPWAGIRSLQEDITLVDNMRALGHDNVFVMLDTLHAGRAGVTKEEVKRTPGDYFGFIHLCDGPAGPDGDPVLADIHDDLMLYTAREARFYAGEGAMDVKGLIDALPGHDISIELPNLKKMQELGAAGHAKMCLDTAKKCLG